MKNNLEIVAEARSWLNKNESIQRMRNDLKEWKPRSLSL